MTRPRRIVDAYYFSVKKFEFRRLPKDRFGCSSNVFDFVHDVRVDVAQRRSLRARTTVHVAILNKHEALATVGSPVLQPHSRFQETVTFSWEGRAYIKNTVPLRPRVRVYLRQWWWVVFNDGLV